MQQHQQVVGEEQHKVQTQKVIWQTNLKSRRRLADTAAQRIPPIHAVAELRKKTAAKFQDFQQEVDTYNQQLRKLVTYEAAHLNPERVQELAKMKAFDLWVQERPNTKQLQRGSIFKANSRNKKKSPADI